MTLHRGSRYRFGKEIQVEYSPGQVESFHEMRPTTVEAPVGSRYYTTKAGDTFETIAEREYTNGNKWYVLADVNPNIFWPLDLVAGVQIVIPPRSYAELV